MSPPPIYSTIWNVRNGTKIEHHKTLEWMSIIWSVNFDNTDDFLYPLWTVCSLTDPLYTRNIWSTLDGMQIQQLGWSDLLHLCHIPDIWHYHLYLHAFSEKKINTCAIEVGMKKHHKLIIYHLSVEIEVYFAYLIAFVTNYVSGHGIVFSFDLVFAFRTALLMIFLEQ